MSWVPRHRVININTAMPGMSTLSANNARFTLNMEQAFFLDPGVENVGLFVNNATIWNLVYNISQSLGNNHFYVFQDPFPVFNLVIPDGSYSTADLSSTINSLLVAAGGTSGLIALTENFATQRVILQIDGTLAGAGGAQVDFTPADTCRDVLGFNAALQPAVPTNVFTEIPGDNRAAFNNLNFFKVHSDIGQGFRDNEQFDNTIAIVPLTARPGSQIVYQPFNPPRSDASRLRNHLTRTIQVWITDENNNEVNTNEVWSVQLVVEWLEWKAPAGVQQQRQIQSQFS